MLPVTRETSFGPIPRQGGRLYRVAAGIIAEDALRRLCVELDKLHMAALAAASQEGDPLVVSIADGLERCCALAESLLPADPNG